MPKSNAARRAPPAAYTPDIWPSIGDYVEVEIDGVLQFPTPVRVRNIIEHDREPWFFVEGSEAGLQRHQVRAVNWGGTAELTAVHPPRRRGRPKIDGTPTPSNRSFDETTGAISQLPTAKNPKTGLLNWMPAKLLTQRLALSDNRLSRTDVAVLGEILEHLNHKKGSDWHTNDFYAKKLGISITSVERSIRKLRDFGYILRRSVKSPSGDWAHAETTVPALVLAASARSSDVNNLLNSLRGRPHKETGTSPQKKGDLPAKMQDKPGNVPVHLPGELPGNLYVTTSALVEIAGCETSENARPKACDSYQGGGGENYNLIVLDLERRDGAEVLAYDLLTPEGIRPYIELLEKYGEVAEAVVYGVLGNAMIDQSRRHHIRTWNYFVGPIESEIKLAKMSANGMKPGDVPNWRKQKA